MGGKMRRMKRCVGWLELICQDTLVFVFVHITSTSPWFIIPRTAEAKVSEEKRLPTVFSSLENGGW